MKVQLLLLIFLAFISCENKKSTDSEIIVMNQSLDISTILQNLESGMIQYMAIEKVAYTASDVDKCMTFIKDYLIEMSNTKTKQEGIKVINKLVLNLNDLNTHCEHQLIETDQREQICAIITLSGYDKGFNSKNEDLTENLRDW